MLSTWVKLFEPDNEIALGFAKHRANIIYLAKTKKGIGEPIPYELLKFDSRAICFIFSYRIRTFLCRVTYP